MSDTTVQALFYAMLLILPLASLAARRLPRRTIVRFIGAWLAVFGIIFLVIYLLGNHSS